MVRNGGRTGIALTFGFRWALDRDQDKRQKQDLSEKVKAPQNNTVTNAGKTVIKQISSGILH